MPNIQPVNLELIKCRWCHGQKRFQIACTLCGDSTFDHACNDREEPCKYCNGTGIDPEIAAALRVRDEEIDRLRKLVTKFLQQWPELTKE